MQEIGNPPPEEEKGEARNYFYLAHVEGGDVIEVKLKQVLKNDRHAFAVALNHYSNNLLKLYGPFEILDLCRNLDRDGKEVSVLIRRSTPDPTRKVEVGTIRKAISDLVRGPEPKQEKVLGPAPQSVKPPPPPVTKTELPYTLGVW